MFAFTVFRLCTFIWLDKSESGLPWIGHTYIYNTVIQYGTVTEGPECVHDRWLTYVQGSTIYNGDGWMLA